MLRLLGGYSPPAAGQQPDLLADLPQALANRSAREIAATPHQKTLLELESQAALWVLGGLVEAARIGVSGGVVTRGHSDLCFFDLICPTPPRRPWAFRCWPDQKPVHPQGVTRHSPAVTVCALRGTSPVRTRKRRFLMLATMVKHVIGIDPDRDRVTASVVDTATTGEQASGVFGTTRSGYDRLLKWADQHTQAAGRVWSVEGSGSYGAGVTGYLIARGELVKEFNDPAPTRDGAKPDALDARRAARQVLGRPWPSVPRARGDREALRVLETTRQGAQGARVSAINQLKALVVTAPVDLRDQLRGLSTTALVAKCSVFRIPPAPVNELTATKQALRSTARRIRNLNNEIAELKTPIAEMITAAAPQLLNQRGVGPITAAQVLIAWSHPGRCRNEAAFARLAGVAPLQASSGQHTRHRLNRRGDRQLNHSYL